MMQQTLTRRHILSTPRLRAAVMTVILSLSPLSSDAARENPHADLDQIIPFTTCLDCHEKTAQDVAASVHYSFKGNRALKGSPEVAGGVLHGYVPYAGGIGSSNWLWQAQPADKTKAIQSGGCGLCHPGLGTQPGKQSLTADLRNIDCFICHADNYQRQVVREKNGELRIAPSPGQDLLAIARSVKKPTAAFCQRCHSGAGGGTNQMDGVVPTEASDVHFAMGMSCSECHTTFNHKITGGGDLKALEPGVSTVACTNCHTASPHKPDAKDEEKTRNATIFNSHAQKIACQTCHIPTLARDPAQPTLILRDWTKPVRDPATGLYHPTDTMGNSLRAEYRWWNGLFTPKGEPRGIPRDASSKIYPWKKTRYIAVADAQTDTLINLDQKTYAESGNVDLAARIGAESAGQKYSGKWKPVELVEHFLVNHQVAEKAQALRCSNCHDPNGVMDFRALKGKRR